MRLYTVLFLVPALTTIPDEPNYKVPARAGVGVGSLRVLVFFGFFWGRLSWLLLLRWVFTGLVGGGGEGDRGKLVVFWRRWFEGETWFFGGDGVGGEVRDLRGRVWVLRGRRERDGIK